MTWYIKKSLPNHRKKIPTITIVGILHTFVGMDINIWPTYPENLCPNFFFLEKVWLRNTLPTCSLDICPNFRSFFFEGFPKSWLENPINHTWSWQDKICIKHHTENMRPGYWLGLAIVILLYKWLTHHSINMGISLVECIRKGPISCTHSNWAHEQGEGF